MREERRGGIGVDPLVGGDWAHQFGVRSVDDHLRRDLFSRETTEEIRHSRGRRAGIYSCPVFVAEAREPRHFEDELDGNWRGLRVPIRVEEGERTTRASPRNRHSIDRKASTVRFRHNLRNRVFDLLILTIDVRL